MNKDKKIAVKLTMDEVRAYHAFIDNSTLEPDIETASAIRKVYTQLSIAINEVDHDGK